MDIKKRGIRQKALLWMYERKLRQKEIRAALGHSSPAIVSETLTGKRDHRKVLRYLLDQGCPAEYLALPKDMRDAA